MCGEKMVRMGMNEGVHREEDSVAGDGWRVHGGTDVRTGIEQRDDGKRLYSCVGWNLVCVCE